MIKLFKKNVDKKQKEFLKLMEDYVVSNYLSLNENDIKAYAQMFYVISELINDKLDFIDILNTYDLYNDVLINKRPDIALLNEKNKFIGIFNLINQNSMFIKLNIEEKKYLAFSIFYATCIIKHDDTTNQSTSAITDFTSVDKIKKLYIKYKQSDPKHFNLEYKIPDSKDDDDDYGHDLEKPIKLISVQEIYKYLNNICLEDGTNIKYEREFSTVNSKDERIDVFKITKNEIEFDKLYISSYANRNSIKLPQGYKFK